MLTLHATAKIAGNIDFFDPNNKVHAPRGFKRYCELVLCDAVYTMPLESVTARAWASDNTDNYTERRVGRQTHFYRYVVDLMTEKVMPTRKLL